MWHGRDGRGRCGGCFAVTPLMAAWLLGLYQALSEHLPLLYIYRQRERAKEREAGWRALMLPLQHDREPGERRHICHRINFPLSGTWVSGAAPVCCTHTLMTSDRIQKLPIVGWWTPVKSFHTEIYTLYLYDTTTDVCVWFLLALVYLIYSLPFYS